MWMMTKHGFYSIVQKSDGFHIRSRERQDLENLAIGIGGETKIERIAVYDEQGALVGYVNGRDESTYSIFETPNNDYRFRIITDGETLQKVMAWIGRTCDYDNFKSRIDSDPRQKHKPYHEVWGVLARALGAYGRKGQR